MAGMAGCGEDCEELDLPLSNLCRLIKLLYYPFRPIPENIQPGFHLLLILLLLLHPPRSREADGVPGHILSISTFRRPILPTIHSSLVSNPTTKPALLGNSQEYGRVGMHDVAPPSPQRCCSRSSYFAVAVRCSNVLRAYAREEWKGWVIDSWEREGSILSMVPGK